LGGIEGKALKEDPSSRADVGKNGADGSFFKKEKCDSMWITKVSFAWRNQSPICLSQAQPILAKILLGRLPCA
jgi:hypothetical protein